MSVSIARLINLAALAAFAGTGLMQGAQQATFHLPVAVHWGQVVLEPGDYKMYLPERSTGEMEFLVKGDGKSIYEIPMITSAQNVSTSSYFRLREIDGAYFIREFTSGPSGVTFTFPVPKANRRESVAKGTYSSIAVAGN